MKREGICKWKGCTQEAVAGRVLCVQHMGPTENAEEYAARVISNKVRLLTNDRITTDEFNYNALLHFADMPESCWHAGAEVIPPAVARMFRDYVGSFLVSVDFMPSPTVFMVGAPSDEEIEHKKREMRPTYVALHEFWQSRPDS